LRARAAFDQAAVDKRLIDADLGGFRGRFGERGGVWETGSRHDLLAVKGGIDSCRSGALIP
jgi:hypothetical protein